MLRDFRAGPIRNNESLKHLCALLATLFISALPAQEWIRARGPGELLPPALGGPTTAMPDLSIWEFAWEFQRDALAAERPSRTLTPERMASVIRVLRKQAGADDVELAILSLWALARIGRADRGASVALREIVFNGAARRSAPVGEVAVIAIGLASSGEAREVQALCAIANDEDAGRALVGAPAVPERMRCFALYGLGLAAEAHPFAELQFLVLAGIERSLLPSSKTPTQVRIAALHALSLLNLQATPKLSAPVLLLLEQEWSLVVPRQLLSVRAHVPLVAAAALRATDAAADAWRHRFVAAMQNESEHDPVRRSCAQALGRLSGPEHTRVVESLRSITSAAQDAQTRNLAFFSLGAIAGAENTNWLMSQLQRNSPMAILYEAPWLAVGLGSGRIWRGEPINNALVTLLGQKAETHLNPASVGAFAVALGCCGTSDSAGLMQKILKRMAEKDAAAAPLCAALSLLDDTSSLPQLKDLAISANSPRTSSEAMLACGVLGAEPTLRTWMGDAQLDPSRRHAAAVALRGKADVEATDALVRMLGDDTVALTERRFAAFAIGSLCDRSGRHWSAKLAAAVDYRNATPALVGPPNGVLRLP